ncbi:hypothetical protein P170DRAFT_127582 [Aspergillus steynii IBT 23096]|uniref:NWD NACHT-NTPase N-terminal domain-containing protein n=1 Tax=Aspergillus steynii IBT 23096 TaxID=1392250 RepID=A0A2I2GK93_9EURO|nr:uncharacterized protein P170DRAFT_127582 [Aspergillus steynii IBT 23096]PLB53279.1 hypothetical protein P170DRAFT_127582 [Aspergillus steynii IBT 23096]
MRNLPTSLESLREKALEKQWGYENSQGEKIYFRDIIDRIVKWVGVFKDPGTQLAGLDPTKAASFVWGFVQFFVERAVVYSETRDLAIDQEPIANLISRYALIEHFYLNNTPGSAGEVNDAVKEKIVELYSAIILYQMAVYRFWTQGKITHGVQSLVPHELKDLSSNIQRKSDEVELILNISDRELLHELLKNSEPIAHIGSQLRRVLDVVMDIEVQKYSDVLKWVSPILHMDHHRSLCPMEGTGKWLLEHPD